MTYRTNLRTIMETLASELAASVDGDTPEYRESRMRLLQVLTQVLEVEDRLEALSNDKSSGPYERITRGVT